MAISEEQLVEFGLRGYLLLRHVVPPDAVARANDEVDRIVAASPPPDGYVGHHFYWPTAGESPTLHELVHESGIAELGNGLVSPNRVGIAFGQTQIAMNIPVFSHRPGGPHLDGYAEDRPVPATFSLLAAVLLTDQVRENCGNLWVWPGTHRVHAAYFRKHGARAFNEAKGYPPITWPEPVQILGEAGDVLLAHYLLGHNIGGNYESAEIRRALYWRLRVEGHGDRWGDCLQDEFLEYPAVRGAIASTSDGPTFQR
jgi:Phytanoyl-CoA dioxygenase (PhyH)